MKKWEEKAGLLKQISALLDSRNISILSMREHADATNNRFFARIEIDQAEDALQVEEQLHDLLPCQAMVKIKPVAVKKIIVLVTREHHCLADILVRNQFKTLGASVQCVIGNHSVLHDICDRFGIPFHLVSHQARERTSFEQEVMEIIERYEMDYLVLAKFMRILSPAFVERLPMRIINIHHSFLPAFIGSNAYRKAFERGVKLIGATAHFVTNELDEGPIIVQQIIPVNHAFTVEDMISSGREIETAVLSRALQLVLDDRVFVYENKTVVFE